MVKILKKKPSVALPLDRKGIGTKAKGWLGQKIPRRPPEISAAPNIVVCNKSPADPPMRRVKQPLKGRFSGRFCQPRKQCSDRHRFDPKLCPRILWPYTNLSDSI